MSHKVCALVGVGAGLGLAIAQRFGREGYQLALLARRPEALAEYTKNLNDAEATMRNYSTDGWWTGAPS